MKTNDKISRREFLKRLGAGAAMTSAALATGCTPKRATTAAHDEVPDEGMTYRTNPTSGDRVSLLGFGMMRLPMTAAREGGKGDEAIDQE
ncbi:MAG: twin-arginine translocation signal domain-containing protein, partial [Alistipes sp.]|nr:twin-arginine translocation signal domain-containing protein [Alistipes sp.]